MLACDQQDCPVSTDFNHEEIRLNCGHTFHRGCLFADTNQDVEHNYAMVNAVNCPVCFEPLQQHMENLATTLNRWAFDKIFIQK